jgi:hypothetical protein
MRPTEDIKRIIEIAKIKINPAVKKAALAELINELENSRIDGQPDFRTTIWRIIMKSKITKIAAVAVLIGLVVFGVTFVEKTSAPAYAVEQTIEAMRKVTTVHCLGKTFGGEKIEMWFEVNPETGANDKLYIDFPERKVIAVQDEAYTYQKKMNIVTHFKKGGILVSNTIRFGRYIEDILDNTESPNTITINEIKGEKPHILLVIETNVVTLECKVDPITKLPISWIAKPKDGQQSGMGFAEGIDEIFYNEPVPEGIFDFKIPEGAQVIEQ